MNYLRKLDGRTNVCVEERQLTISRDDFMDAIEALWTVARYEHSTDMLRVSVWASIPGSLLSRPRYIFELS